MKNSSGSVSQALTREVKKASGDMLVAYSGIGVPFSAEALVQAMRRF